MEFVEVGRQVTSRPFSHGHDPCLAAFACDRDPGRLVHPHVLECQGGEFADPGGGVVHEDREHAVPARFGVAGVPRGQQGLGVFLLEVVDGFSRGWFDAYGGRVVGQCGQRRMLEARVAEECAHRRHPQHDGAVRVSASGPHPFGPPAQVRPVEMPEPDVVAFHAFHGLEPSDVGFQADAACLDGLRRVAAHAGKPVVQPAARDTPEIRFVRPGVHRSCRVHGPPVSGDHSFGVGDDIRVPVHEIGAGVHVVGGAADAGVSHVGRQVGQHRHHVHAVASPSLDVREREPMPEIIGSGPFAGFRPRKPGLRPDAAEHHAGHARADRAAGGGDEKRRPVILRGCLIVCVWDHLMERKRSW